MGMDLSRYHRLTPSYGRLEGQRCAACGALQFPARLVCRACGGGDLAAHRLSGRGRVVSWAEVAQPPAGFEGPYFVAIVELEEGIRVTAQLTDLDPEEVDIGLPVVMVTRRIQDPGEEGYLVYGYKFRPILEPIRRALSLVDAAQ
jgi:uncharacterized protein